MSRRVIKNSYFSIEIKENNKGITLIALIVTIIILIILAGISIALLTGENGIITKTQKAKIENKRANVKEIISLAQVEEKLKNYGAENRKILEAIRENLLNKDGKDNLGRELYNIGKDISIWDIQESQGEIYFYVIVDGDVYKVTVDKVEFIGEQSKEDIEIQKGDITFNYEPSEWTNGKVKVRIESDVKNVIEPKILYKIDDGKWNEYTEEVEVEKNCDIYAKISGINGETTVATGTVANIDKDLPSIGEVNGSNTTSNVGTITVKGITDVGGSGIVGYYVSNNNTAPTTSSSWTTLTGDNFTYNVGSNGTYYVWVKDKAGNISEVKSCTISGIVAKVSVTSYQDVTLLVGNTIATNLKYTGSPKSISYTTLNASIATVNSSTGTITGVAAGTTTITVTLTNYDNTTVTRTIKATVEEGVAKIGNVHYATVKEAANAVTQNASTIEVFKSTTEKTTIEINTSYTTTIKIDQDVTINSYGITNNGNLHIEGNGMWTTPDISRPLIVNSGTLKVGYFGNGDIGGTTLSSYYQAIYNTGGTVNIKMVNKIHSDYINAIFNSGGTINIQYATISSNGESPTLLTSGDSVTNFNISNYVKIVGSENTNSDNCAIDLKAPGTTTINGATIESITPESSGANAIQIENSGATVIMSSGTITKTSSGDNGHGGSHAVWVSSGTFELTGGNIKLNNKSNIAETIDVESGAHLIISGGTVLNEDENGKANGKAILSDGSVEISGGTIKGGISDNYAIKINSTGTLSTPTGGTGSVSSSNGRSTDIYDVWK